MKRILIIEDDECIREALTDIMQTEGFLVEAASNGAEGIERLRCSHPDLILLDLMMPVKNGFEFREEQLSNPDFADVPVVVMTAGSRQREDELRLRPGDFLKKPLDIEHLLDSVHRWAPAGTGPGDVDAMPSL